MARFQLKKDIAAPIEVVFELFTDFERAPQRVPEIVKLELLTEGPLRVGTRFRETRQMFGREATEEMEVTQLEQNKLITVTANTCGSRVDTTFHFYPAGGGTKVEMDFVCEPQTLSAKLMMPVGWVFMGAARKAMEKDMDRLKHAAETRRGV